MQQKNRQAGFTLIEIIVVVVVMTVMMAAVGTSLIKWRPNFEIRAAADDLYTDFNKAKLHAIKNNVNVLFSFDYTPGKNRYTFQEEGGGEVVAEKILSGGTLLGGDWFAAGSGFSPKGLPLAGLGRVHIEHQKFQDSGDPMYIVRVEAAGAVTSARSTK